KIHLQSIGAIALAGLAASARLVEAEAARLVAAHLRLGQLREQRADLVEDLDVRRWVRARRAANRRLIDVDDLVELLGPQDAVVCPDRVLGQILCPIAVLWLVSAVADAVALLEPLLQDVIDQRGFARSADSRNANEQAEREVDIDVLQVMVASALDRDALAIAGATLGRDGDLLL